MPVDPHGFPPFPRALLAALRESAPEGSALQIGLWHGESLSVRTVLRETEEGLLAELAPAPTASDDRGPTVVAVPWHAIARVQASPAPARKTRTGFAPTAH